MIRPFDPKALAATLLAALIAGGVPAHVAAQTEPPAMEDVPSDDEPVSDSDVPSLLPVPEGLAEPLPEEAAPPATASRMPPPGQGGMPFSFADLADDLLGSVVNISTSQRVTVPRGIPMPDVPEGQPFQEFFEDFFDENGGGTEPSPRRVQSLGSGFVIDPSGLIVTNNHVIADADEIIANFADGTKLTATVRGRDEKTDLALLEVTPEKPLTAVSFGRSEALRVGEWVMAIGNPFGFGGTVTVGIVSALDRDINSGPYDDFIQTDASINRGNSGGPLFNLAGEVIGINTAIMSPTGGSIGIGFSVPTDLAVPVIEQLKEFGETRRGWIGVRIQEVTDEIAESIGLDQARGALIAGLMEDGPAEAAELKPGDLILEFDGTEVTAMRSLPRIVADTPPGETVDMLVMRDGEEVTIPIEVGRLEESETDLASAEDEETSGDDDSAQEAEESVSAFGLTLNELTEDLRTEHSIADEISGVVVTEVEPGSVAHEKNVEVGDVIVEVSQRAVESPEAVMQRFEELKEQGRRSVLLLIADPNNEMRFVSMRFDDQ